MIKVSLSDAKKRLMRLIRAVEAGESVTICRRGIPVVEMVRTAKPSETDQATGMPKFGSLKGRIIEVDPDWWKPMTDEEADDFLEGRY